MSDTITIDDETHLLMSKKIAILIKGISLLKCKNQENDLHKTIITEMHEKEMENILRQANLIISKLKN
jgi:hypothetical protein